MPRSSSRGDLFITVGGNVTPLRASMKAGQSVLNEFGLAAIDVTQEVDRAFANMASNAPAEAKKLEQAFTRTFSEIRRNAQTALKAPQGGAVEILNAAGARDAAAAAEAEAAALRQLADAAKRADTAAGGTNAGVRVLAISTETAAREAAEYATALRAQAGSLDLVENQIVRNTAGQRNLRTVSAQSRAGMQQLGFQLNDVAVGFASGQKASIIFAQQISQVTQAVQLMSGGTSKFANFIGGPWGIALTLGVTVLAPLVGKMLEGEDASKKFKDETDLLRAALDGQKISTDALTQSLQKLNEQELKALDNDTKLIDSRISLAKATLAVAEANKTRAETELAAAKAERDAAAQRLSRASGRGVEAAGGELAIKQANVDRLQSAVDAQSTIISQATALLTTEVVRLARNASTEVGKVNIEFDRRQKALEEQFRGTERITKLKDGSFVTTLQGGLLNAPGITNDRRQQLLLELTKKEHDLNVERQKAIVTAQKLDQAEQGKAKADRSNRQSGRQISFDEASAIAKAAGLQVNSSRRPSFIKDEVPGGPSSQERLFNNPNVNRPGNPVAPPGSSAHNGANGKWAIDIQITDGVTPSKIRKIFADQGVSLTKVFKEAGHFHVEGSRSEAEKAERDEQRAATKAIDQQNNFEEQRARLKEQLVHAEGEMLSGAEAQSDASRRQIKADHDIEELKIQNALEEGKYGEATSAVAQARAAELQAINDSVQEQELANQRLKDAMRAANDDDRDASQLADFKIDEKEYQESIARTAGERRTLALEILDLVYEEKKRHLEYLKAQADLAGETREAARIQAEINDLPRQKAQDADRANRDNLSPMQDYLDKLPHSLADINEELEKLEVRAIEQLTDKLGEATAKALGLKGALGDLVASLVKLGIQSLISYLSGGFSGGISFGGARAGGGDVDAGKVYRVGEHGEEWFLPGVSGTIIPNHIINTARAPRIPRGIHGAPANDVGGGGWGRTIVQNFSFPNSDYDSFRRNERQMRRDGRRGLGISNR